MRDWGILKRPSQLTQEPEMQLLPPKLFLESLLRKCAEPKNQIIPISGVLQPSFHPASDTTLSVVPWVCLWPMSHLTPALVCHRSSTISWTQLPHICVHHPCTAGSGVASWQLLRLQVLRWHLAQKSNLILRPESLIPGGGLWHRDVWSWV